MLIQDTPHRRYNPLTGEWILVSSHRGKRPWQGQEEKPLAQRPAYDPACYLCPGNARANGEQNPPYEDIFVFTNDFAALLPKPKEPKYSSVESPLLTAQAVEGTCRVICYSPRHDLTLATMPLDKIKRVIRLWIEQITELEQTYPWVQIFENKGTSMGCSNPHPHGQIWASSTLPNEILKEDRMQAQYYQQYQRVLLQDYAALELEKQERVVLDNPDWMVVVPFWAIWPFETLLLPKFPVRHLAHLSEPQQATLAAILKKLLVKYDNLFHTEFPYAMGWHSMPANGNPHTHWQLHAHFYPPLLRSATIRKFVAGYELLSELQRDITAETAAQRLRDCPCTPQ